MKRISKRNRRGDKYQKVSYYDDDILERMCPRKRALTKKSPTSQKTEYISPGKGKRVKKDFGYLPEVEDTTSTSREDPSAANRLSTQETAFSKQCDPRNAHEPMQPEATLRNFGKTRSRTKQLDAEKNQLHENGTVHGDLEGLPDNGWKGEAKFTEVIDKEMQSCRQTRIFNLSHKKFGGDDFEYLIFKMNQLPKEFQLKEKKLRNCNVGKKFLEYLVKNPRKVKKIDFSANKQLQISTLMKFLEKSNTESLDLSDCALSESDLETLCTVQVNILKLNYKAFACPSVQEPLGHILTSGLKTLEVVNSSISVDDLQALAFGPKICLTDLDLSHVALNADGMEAISRIVNRTNGMERLVLSDCEISNKALKKFYEIVAQQIEELDISYNTAITKIGDSNIPSIIKKCGTKKLDISGRQLTKSNIKGLLSDTNTQVHEIVLTENPAIDAAEVGTLLRKWKVQTVIMRECRLDADDLIQFRQNLQKHKVKYLDLSESAERPTDEKIQAIKDLAGCVQEKIVFRCKELSSKQRSSLDEISDIFKAKGLKMAI